MKNAITITLAVLLALTCASADEAVDWLGDPLPPGATHRLGTQRMRFSSGLRDMAYSHDSARALMVSGNTLDAWDLTRGERLGTHRVSEDSGELRLIAASRRGPVALVADSAGVVYEWDFEANRLLHRFATGRERLVALRYSPDEERVLTLDRATSIIEEWAKATGDRLAVIEPGEEQFGCAIYGPEGRTALAGSYDHMGNGPNVFHYDLATGEILGGLLPGKWVGVYDLDLSPDGERVLARLRYGHTTEWRLSDHEIVASGFRARGRPGPSARYAGNDDWLLTGSRDGTVRVWDRHTGEVVRQWAPHTGWVRMIRVSPDGKWAMSYASGRVVADTSIETGLPRLAWARHTSAVHALALSRDGSRLVTGSSDRTIRVWNADGWDGGAAIEVPGGGVLAVAVSPDGRRALAGAKDGVIREFDVATGELVRSLTGHCGHVHAVLCLDDGRVLSAADDGSLRLWSAAGEEAERVMTGHLGGVMGVAVSPDGDRALSVGRDCSLREWDLTTGRALHSVLAHRGEVHAVAYAPDGLHAVTGSRDGLVIEWDLSTWQPRRILTHGSRVTAVGYLLDGAAIVSAGANHKVVLSDRETGEATRTLSGHTGSVNALALTADGSRLLTGSDDTTTLVWSLR